MTGDAMPEGDPASAGRTAMDGLLKAPALMKGQRRMTMLERTRRGDVAMASPLAVVAVLMLAFAIRAAADNGASASAPAPAVAPAWLRNLSSYAFWELFRVSPQKLKEEPPYGPRGSKIPQESRVGSPADPVRIFLVGRCTQRPEPATSRGVTCGPRESEDVTLLTFEG